MAPEPDFTLLDRPDLVAMMFYPRRDATPPPPDATDHRVPVGADIAVHCRLYRREAAAPTILYFHGNGEVVADHDSLAPLYADLGVNLFVADYRGYGQSTGRPTFSTLITDADLIWHALCEIRETSGLDGPVYVMGRSLGSLPAVRLAGAHGAELGGWIVESGAAGARWSGFARGGEEERWAAFQRYQEAWLRGIHLRLLAIHGERDQLIPVERAVEFQALVGAADKELVIIPGAGHNDLLYFGLEEYMGALRHFIFG